MALEERAADLDGDGAPRRRPGVEQGDRMLVKPDGATERSLGDGDLDRAAREAALELLEAERSEVRPLPGSQGEARAFVEVLEPPLRLWSAAPVTTPLPWSRRRRTSAGARSSSTTGPSSQPRAIPPMPRTSCSSNAPTRWPRSPISTRARTSVVMSHNFLRDKDYVRSLLTSPARFIAMLGPAVRTERLLTELRDEGVDISDAHPARIRGPAGLDLGAEGAEEIAAAIVAEIVAVKRGRGCRVPQGPPGPIHERHGR
jgi:xanthine/CO dehydrogenase XdhC/CoxF family maturation factor